MPPKKRKVDKDPPAGRGRRGKAATAAAAAAASPSLSPSLDVFDFKSPTPKKASPRRRRRVAAAGSPAQPARARGQKAASKRSPKRMHTRAAEDAAEPPPASPLDRIIQTVIVSAERGRQDGEEREEGAREAQTAATRDDVIPPPPLEEPVAAASVSVSAPPPCLHPSHPTAPRPSTASASALPVRDSVDTKRARGALAAGDVIAPPALQVLSTPGAASPEAKRACRRIVQQAPPPLVAPAAAADETEVEPDAAEDTMPATRLRCGALMCDGNVCFTDFAILIEPHALTVLFPTAVGAAGTGASLGTTGKVVIEQGNVVSTAASRPRRGMAWVLAMRLDGVAHREGFFDDAPPPRDVAFEVAKPRTAEGHRALDVDIARIASHFHPPASPVLPADVINVHALQLLAARRERENDAAAAELRALQGRPPPHASLDDLHALRETLFDTLQKLSAEQLRRASATAPHA